MGRRIRRKRQKLVGWDKNSLTEQQREKKITSRTLVKRIYRAQFSQSRMLSLVPSSKSLFSRQLPH